MGRKLEGLRLLQQMEATEPDFISPHRYLKRLYFDIGNHANYLAEMKTEAALMQDSAAMYVATVAAKAFTAGGAQAMLEAIRREQKRLYDQGKLSPYPLAETCVPCSGTRRRRWTI